MNDLSEVVERLARNIEALDRRVTALEDPARRAALVTPQPVLATPGYAAESLSGLQGGGTFSVFGKAMLCVAGAYVLRAVVASAVLPRTPVIAVAIAYALLWLVPATRVPAKAWFSSVAWSVTSALILIPMLWELTTRFRVLSSGIAAGILCGFVVAAAALAWNRHFATVSWVTGAAASIAALALAVVTRDLVPFIAALLVMAIVVEFAAARQRFLQVRGLVAVAADAAVFALIWIYASPAASHPDYAAIAAPLLLAIAPVLLLIYGASASAQTLVLRRGISFFEVAQVLVAALLAVWTIFVFAPGHGILVLGLSLLIASVCGYALAFGWFRRLPAQRNFHVYATGSLALLLAGCTLCLPQGWLSLCLGFGAVGAVALAAATARYTLQFHGLALLTAAAIGCGLFRYGSDAWTGSSLAAPGWIVFFVSLSAILCFASQMRFGLDGWWRLLPRLLFAGLAVGVIGTLLVWALVRLTSLSVTPGAEHIAVIRTLIACVTALALAWFGTHWQRRELVWLAWGTVGCTGAKLLFEDLRHGHLVFTAASIFLFALTLLLVPRLLRGPGRVAPESPGQGGKTRSV